MRKSVGGERRGKVKRMEKGDKEKRK